MRAFNAALMDHSENARQLSAILVEGNQYSVTVSQSHILAFSHASKYF